MPYTWLSLPCAKVKATEIHRFHNFLFQAHIHFRLDNNQF